MTAAPAWPEADADFVWRCRSRPLRAISYEVQRVASPQAIWVLCRGPRTRRKYPRRNRRDAGDLSGDCRECPWFGATEFVRS